MARLFFLLIFIGIAGCGRNAHSPASSADSAATGWHTGPGLSNTWLTAAPAPGAITTGQDSSLQISGNASGVRYVYQMVEVDSQKFYSAQVTADYAINNYFSCGLYIMDSSLQHILAKFERTYSKGSHDTWKVVFFSKAHTHIAIVAGFLNGINATVTLRNPSFTAYDYQPVINSSDLSMHLSRKFPLVFSASQFDSTISSIADYVNSVLLCKYTYHADTVELPILNTMIGNDSNYTWFNRYRRMVNELPVAYCQKSSLSLAEILTNEFHIPTRQIHMVFGKEGRHQFTEYWNPFAAKWICVDPCFNIHYVRNNALLGIKDFDRTQAPSLMKPFGTHSFHSFLPQGLPWYWKNMDSLMITDHYSLTFPYAR